MNWKVKTKRNHESSQALHRGICIYILSNSFHAICVHDTVYIQNTAGYKQIDGGINVKIKIIRRMNLAPIFISEVWAINTDIEYKGRKDSSHPLLPNSVNTLGCPNSVPAKGWSACRKLQTLPDHEGVKCCTTDLCNELKHAWSPHDCCYLVLFFKHVFNDIRRISFSSYPSLFFLKHILNLKT